ncbi:C6 transcription factor [Pseudozyma hubeiensis SY62]|uniref:C6 transcription factor n=1 Tax=Pseudozyma hubeiensis (strain SY62) TaxID=1305764 RepID=R9PEL7_PSEHS|nr:C6 transcription factor [Pseudozyma hubeiensis SY62]GAC99799.1 C6 transcription factor [Pseudozyma hubeiensis SY62]
MVVNAASADKQRSVNRSCIQCRERKIKCDRLDPCNQCVSKGIGSECKHELRKKRAKNKRPFPKRKSRMSMPSQPLEGPAPSHYRSQAPLEPTLPPVAWAERSMTSSTSQHSEHGQTPSSSSGRIVTPSTSSSAHDFAYSSQERAARSFSARSARPQDVESLPENGSSSESGDSDSDDDDKYPDDRLHTLEAVQLMHIKSAPELRCPFALKDVYAEWRAMPIESRRGLIQEVRSALPSLPQSLHLLHDVYVQRLHSIHGNVVHVPTIRVVLTELLTDVDYERRERVAFGHITASLMVIFAALRFAPLDGTYTWGRSTSSGANVEPLGQKDIRQRLRRIFALVKRIQRFESTFTFGSISELQTAVLMLECGKGSSAFLDSLADCAIRSAIRMRIHRLGTFDRIHSPKAKPHQAITVEMAIRCWWALVRRDWSQSNKSRSYRISPLQFNTRKPLILFDDELLQHPCPRSHLRSTWTHVSYSLASIDFAIMTRTLVDQVNAQSDLDDGPASADGWGLASVFGQRLSAAQRDSLDQKFQSLVASFPAHYSLEARYEVIGLVDVERWLLHQRLFHLFLTLHMPLISEATRPHGSLMYMAGHILDIQDKVADICTRLDNCQLNTLQTLRACLVLLLNLFFTETPVNVSGLSRLMTRRKITAALEKVPMEVSSTKTKVSLQVQLVKLLLGLEEQQHQLQLGSVHPSGDAAVQEAAVALRQRWHATCQILDVLLNEGYWRSFRNNLLENEHSLPTWLQNSLRDELETGDQAALTQEASSSLMSIPSLSENLTNTASSASCPSSRIENAFAANVPQADVATIDSTGLSLAFDPKLLENLDGLDVFGLEPVGSSSELPQLDMDLLGHQDFEGFGNSSQSIDFAKMLMEWRVEVPLA